MSEYTKLHNQLKKTEFKKDGNHMIIETDLKVFNDQCDGICVGNVFGDAQMSSYIRSWWDEGEGLIDYPENKRPPGQLFEYDMKHFEEMRHSYMRILKKIEEYSKVKPTRSMILYMFKHIRNRRRIIHGYVLTDNKYELINRWITGPTYKSYSVITECMKYVCTAKSIRNWKPS
jgi:hypothetical protein